MAKDAQVKAAAVRENLDPIRARLDQLAMRADEEGVRISRETVEALLGEIAALQAIAEEAGGLDNQRLDSEVDKLRQQARRALGFSPRKGRR